MYVSIILTASAVGFSMMLGFMVSAALMDVLGRKRTHIVALCPALTGWLVLRFSSGAATLLAGRILCGLTCGGTIALGAVVIGEYTAPEIRPAALNLKTAATVLGVTFTHLLAHYCHWRTVALLSMIPFSITLLNVLTWPESPAWLLTKKEFERSEQEFYYIRGKSEKSVREFQALLHGQKELLSEKRVTFAESVAGLPKKFTEKDFLKPAALIFVSFFLMEVSGRHYFPAYATDILDHIVSDKSQSFFYTISIDVITIISASFSSILARIYKRRTVLFLSGIFGVLVFSTVSLYLYLTSTGAISKDRPWIPLSLLVLFFVLANLGCTPIPLALLGELFPLRHRAAGSFIGGVFMSMLLLVTVKITPTLLAALNVHGTFTAFSVVMFMTLVYLYWYLPETKGKTLQEIEDYFRFGKGGGLVVGDDKRLDGDYNACDQMLKEKS